jgi:hypothetical protein
VVVGGTVLIVTSVGGTMALERVPSSGGGAPVPTK